MALIAKNITFRYFEKSSRNIIENFSFSLPKGEITLLIGKSGSGKSTLAYLLAGLYPENGGFLVDGEVLFEEEDILKLTPDKRVKAVSMMFQNADLQFCMNTLEQELGFCLENIGVPEEDRERIILEIVNELNVSHLLGRSFFTMSGGEKQKCALCCIFALKSQCIILDEAFANVDVKSAREIIGIIKKMGITVLAIDHNIKLWEGSYDQVVSLDDSQPRDFNIEPQLHTPGKPIINIENLQVRDITYPNMSIEKSSLTAIVGKSGSGKSTLFQTLIGQNKFKGEITIEGKRLNKFSKKSLFSKCGIVFQNPSNQFLALNVYDEIYFSVNRWHKREDDQWKEARTMELLELFELEKYRKYSPYLLSQGQQRRLAVLSMIAGNQGILLLDEPTYGQDYDNLSTMMNLLVEKAQLGLTVIFSTHNETIAQKFSHQVIELSDYTL